MNEIQKQIYETINLLTDEKLKELKFDRTKKGIVKSVEKDSCTVKIDGQDYKCRLRKGIVLGKGDIVFVKFPLGDDRNKYVELTLGEVTNPDYSIITAEEILTKLKTVDGIGSGLDADLLGGKSYKEYLTKDNVLLNNSYIHYQQIPSDTWEIKHNLKCYPAVTVMDSAGSVVVGDIRYVDEDNVSVSFTALFSGKASLR